MLFQDRQEAAYQLLLLLEEFRNKEVVVMAIPRGGVPIGYILAKELNASLDLLLSKKIGAPGNPEYAIGAVGIDFSWVDQQLDIDPGYIQTEINRIRTELKRKQQPDSIIIATPVCSPQARAMLEPQVEQLISCADPDPFIGVGRFYQNFEEITDQQVLTLLNSFYHPPTHAAKN